MVWGIVRETGVRIRIRHTLNFRCSLLRELGNSVEIQIIGLRAGNLHPTQKGFCIPGLDRHAMRGRSLARHLTDRRLIFPSIEFFISRNILKNTSIPAVDDVHGAFFVDRDPIGKIQLSFCLSAISPRTEERPVAVELLDAMVAGIDDIDIAEGIASNSPWRFELAEASSFSPPLGKKAPAGVELLNAIIA